MSSASHHVFLRSRIQEFDRYSFTCCPKGLLRSLFAKRSRKGNLNSIVLCRVSVRICLILRAAKVKWLPNAKSTRMGCGSPSGSPEHFLNLDRLLNVNFVQLCVFQFAPLSFTASSSLHFRLILFDLSNFLQTHECCTFVIFSFLYRSVDIVISFTLNVSLQSMWLPEGLRVYSGIWSITNGAQSVYAKFDTEKKSASDLTSSSSLLIRTQTSCQLSIRWIMLRLLSYFDCNLKTRESLPTAMLQARTKTIRQILMQD